LAFLTILARAVIKIAIIASAKWRILSITTAIVALELVDVAIYAPEGTALT
jgi:hypothetical protein